MNNLKNNFLNYDYLFAIPQKESYLNFLLAFYVVFILFTFFYVFISRAKYGKGEIQKTFRKKFFWVNLVLGISGLFLVFSRYQNLPLFSLRIINYTLLISILSYNIYLVVHYKRNVLKKLSKKKEKDRVEKWLPKKSKKA